MGGVQGRHVNETLDADLACAARDESRGVHVHVGVREVHRLAHETRADQVDAHIRVLECALHARLVEHVRGLQARGEAAGAEYDVHVHVLGVESKVQCAEATGQKAGKENRRERETRAKLPARTKKSTWPRSAATFISRSL